MTFYAMPEIAKTQKPLFDFFSNDAEMRTCKLCGEHLPATLEFFYSAGKKKGKQYLASKCIGCSKKIRKAKFHNLSLPSSKPIQNEADKSQVMPDIEYVEKLVQIAWTAYNRARDLIKRGMVNDVSYRQLRLKQWQKAETTLRALRRQSQNFQQANYYQITR